MPGDRLRIKLTVWVVTTAWRLTETLDWREHLIRTQLVGNVALVGDSRQFGQRDVVAIVGFALAVDIVNVSRILAVSASSTPRACLILVDLSGVIRLHGIHGVSTSNRSAAMVLTVD